MKQQPPIPWLSLLLTASVITVYQFAQTNDAANFWIYSRSAIMQGELWRLITGHLVHYSAEHMGWDLAAFLMLASFTEYQLGHKDFFRLWLVLAVFISSVLLLIVPKMEIYAGISGINYGLLAFWIVRASKRSVWVTRIPPMVHNVMIGTVLVLPVLLQARAGLSFIADYPTAVVVAWQAHLAGILMAWLLASQRRYRFGLPRAGSQYNAERVALG